MECFVKFGKSGFETPETHHETAAIAPPFRHLGNKNAGNQACTRRKYTTILPSPHHHFAIFAPQFCHFHTTISPFPHRIFAANKPCNRLKNKRNRAILVGKRHIRVGERSICVLICLNFGLKMMEWCREVGEMVFENDGMVCGSVEITVRK